MAAVVVVASSSWEGSGSHCGCILGCSWMAVFPLAADDEKEVEDWERKQFALQGNRYGSDLQSQV